MMQERTMMSLEMAALDLDKEVEWNTWLATSNPAQAYQHELLADECKHLAKQIKSLIEAYGE